MIEQQVMDSSSQQPIVPSDFQNANAIIDSISTPKDSQPTKLKVKNFKNRVFHLLKIYTTQSANINPLIQCLKQDMFFHEPEKMQELLQNILNKENVTLENLQQLLEYYKVILLYKCDQKTNDTVTPQFLRLMKKISTLDQELTNSTLISMLKAFLYERKCKLNVNFFFYFFRKYEHSQEIKKIFIEKCQESLQDEKLRNAQKKQLNKILQRIDKTFRVNQNKVKKQQHMQIEEEEADSNDVKATNKKKSNLTKVEKKEQVKKVKGNEKIEEEGEQGEEKKSKKQIPIEQQQKLQRIKQNKKNKRKQNQKSQPQQPNQDTHKNNHANKEQKKNNDNNQKNNNQQKGNNENKTVDEPKKAHGNKFANKKPNNPPAENSQKHSESKERPHQKEGHSNSKPKFDKGAKRPQQDRSQSKPKFDKAAKRPQQDNRSQSKPKFNKDFKKPHDNHSRSKPKFDKGNKRPQTPNSK